MLHDPEQARVLRAITDRLDEAALVRRFNDVLGDAPAFARFSFDGDGLSERGLAAIRWNVGLLVRWLTGGNPPSASERGELVDLIRMRASEGRAMEDGLFVYRNSLRALWDELHALATDAERPTLDRNAAILWGYQDIVGEAFGAAYAAESDTPGTAGERRAHALLERLASAEQLSVEDAERAARLGFALEGPFRPFVAQLAGAPVRDHILLASRLRADGALAATQGTRVAGVTPAGLRWDPYFGDPRLLLAVEEATGREHVGAALARVHALAALAAAAGRRGYAEPGEFLPELLLHGSPDLATRLAERVFGPLDDQLAQTLAALAAHDFDRAATAAALPVHRNTLLYRLNRIHALTGLDVQVARDRGTVWLAALWRAA